jgi:hypothetical protein
MHYHPLVQYFASEGVPILTVTLLLMLPIIATLVAIFRQVIGIKAFGIYTPSIITFALFAMGDLKYGVAVFVSIIIVGMLSRFGLRRFRLLYLPRVAITLSIISLAILLLLLIGGHNHRTGFAGASVFPLLIMITRGKICLYPDRKGTRIPRQTLIISTVYFHQIYSGNRYPLILPAWIIVLTFIINITLGKLSGLRLSEYWRFRQIFKHL